MSRTIKISELKKFDVFRYPKLHPDYSFLYIGGEDYNFVTTACKEHNPHTFRFTDKEQEVELLGRMEFVCDGKETKTEFEAEMAEEYYRNNQGAQ